ncbi:hypothetical protein AtubIFM56815_003875 [Aspergillus tubingensis]|uniref:Zn(2)-C6 fungal-type domain-containing protein n=2 Tax=Aspergillus subgen. Circumdati TaxID=2720871 RepID=A0A100ITJ4_ASPNG|nr:hypothetical protein AKAW_07241 [Aspergillus niger]GLA89398.1 hypothetical protein AtubIFM56815_003875 [Aspergillus tubingensis]GLB01135.1 hypothetical protein AtubIFM57143_010513 [Aspergillus tubingensis]
MVNYGPSGGCVTCKARRVKCDEAKPECHSCQRLNLRCGGYKSKPVKIRFKDQTSKVCNDIASRHAAQHQQLVPCLRSLSDPDSSVPFFIRHYAMMGRDMKSSRGFFEMLVPVYASEKQNSALSLAVTATASEIMSRWRHESSSRASRETYAQAIKCLRKTIEDRNEWTNPATILAVLALQFYENFAVIYGSKSATRVHHDAAVSLLPFTDQNCPDGSLMAHIRRYILHIEISSAIRQKRLLQSTALARIGCIEPKIAPGNFGPALDAIGAFVAELHASYWQHAAHEGSMFPTDIPRNWIAEAKRIDEQLLAWAQKVPQHLQPVRLTDGSALDPSIPTYNSICDVYISCQIGTLWNEWRAQRLLIVKIILSSLSTNPPGRLAHSDAGTSTGDEDFARYKYILQELIDSVCYSVPFYLGNQGGWLSIPDLTDPSIRLPSYRLLGNANQQKSAQKSEDEHRSHIIAQGPWHIMSMLSRVVVFFIEDYGQVMVSFLRPGQLQWVREQFLRVTQLLRIPLEEASDADGRFYPLDRSVHADLDGKIDNLARRVRKGAFI